MGKLVEIKTKQNDASIDEFIASVAGEQKQKDCYTILEIMQKASKEPPKMWGSSIIGFGNIRYKSPNTDREVDWFKIGFFTTQSESHDILTRHFATTRRSAAKDWQA